MPVNSSLFAIHPDADRGPQCELGAYPCAATNPPMRTIDQWLDAYGESHRNTVNKAIHRIAVPVIVLDVLGALHLVPTAGLPRASWWLVAGALAFYVRLSPALAAGMALLVLPSMVALDAGLVALGTHGLPVLVAVFGLAWAAQFVGHAIEGEKPSFFEDVQFLLIGPLWLLADAYRRLGVAPRALRAS